MGVFHEFVIILLDVQRLKMSLLNDEINVQKSRECESSKSD